MFDRPPFTDVLVPLDGSAPAERALGPALDVATRAGVPLRLLRQVRDGEGREGKEAAGYLARLAGRVAGGTDIETLVLDRENVPGAIMEGLEPGSLVCLSSHGRGGVARAVLGSVAEALLRSVDRPALVVGPDVDVDAPLAGRVVACVDGSPESERVLEPARCWARLFDLPLWLMEVVAPDALPGHAAPGDVAESAHVAHLARDLGDVEGWDVLHDDDAARALTATAAEEAPWRTAMLVMATHGRTGWDRLRLGSVTTATVRRSVRPVLVVPATPIRRARASRPATTAVSDA